MESSSTFGRIATGVYRAIDSSRRFAFNMLFLLIVIILLAVLMRGDEPPVEIEDGIAVVVDPAGWVVEEYTVSPLDRAVNRMLGDDVPQVRLRDLRATLAFAADDERVSVIVLDLSRLAPVSLSKLDELAEPLLAARENGKQVLVWSEFYGQSQYMLAAHAGRVLMHPMGGVFIDGYGAYRTYMREALEKLSVDWHVFKVGDYKSYAEPYERDEMSPQVREETSEWLGALWTLYQQRTESARGLEAGAVSAYVDEMVPGLREVRGNLARYAEQRGLVDGLVDRDRFVDEVTGIVGEAEDGDGFRGLDWKSYLAAARRERAPELSGRDRVALVIASGQIVGGDPGMEVMGADRITELVDRAADNDRVKALVLRVDSPGGSAIASEQIRRSLERFRESGRPVVVSMSSVAASGGYWISLASDEIWANPATITGSIGVIAMFPTVPRTLERLGLNVDGVGTTKFSGAFRIDRALTDEMGDLLQLSVEGVYHDFVERVAASREMEYEGVDAIAGGRVYSGLAAREIGLVDKLGGLDEAIESAAGLADLDEYAVMVVERPMTPREKLLISFLESRSLAPLAESYAHSRQRPLAGLLAWVQEEFGFISALSDPRHTYLHCFCVSP